MSWKYQHLLLFHPAESNRIYNSQFCSHHRGSMQLSTRADTHSEVNDTIPTSERRQSGSHVLIFIHAPFKGLLSLQIHPKVQLDIKAVLQRSSAEPPVYRIYDSAGQEPMHLPVCSEPNRRAVFVPGIIRRNKYDLVFHLQCCEQKQPCSRENQKQCISSRCR